MRRAPGDGASVISGGGLCHLGAGGLETPFGQGGARFACVAEMERDEVLRIQQMDRERHAQNQRHSAREDN